MAAPLHGALRCHVVAATIWIAALALVTVRHTSDAWWPLSPGAMFSYRAEESDTLDVEASHRGHTPVRISPRDFGLSGAQLPFLPERAMGPRVGFEDRSLLAELARWWNARHREAPIATLTLKVHRVVLRDSLAPIDASVLTWRAST